MLDLHRLRVFRAVAASGSMRRAAEGLGYTPSAVSQHVAALQQQTGLALVEREGRGVRLTATGRAVAEAADRVLAQAAELESTIEALRRGQAGALTLRYVTTVGAAWMPGVVARVTAEFPELRLHLRLAEQAAEGPEPADVEVLVVQPGSGPPAGVEQHPLLEEPYVAIVPEGHPSARRGTVSLTQLAAEPWIDNDPTEGPCRRLVLDACAAVGVAPRFQVEAHDYTTAMAFVAAGLGVTVVPRLAHGDHRRPGVVMVPLEPPGITRHVAVRVRASLRENPAARRILELLHEHAAGASA